jgi:hypothetical protein
VCAGGPRGPRGRLAASSSPMSLSFTHAPGDLPVAPAGPTRKSRTLGQMLRNNRMRALTKNPLYYCKHANKPKPGFCEVRPDLHAAGLRIKQVPSSCNHHGWCFIMSLHHVVPRVQFACQVSVFFSGDMVEKVKRWRADYDASDEQRRLDGVLSHLSSCLRHRRHGLFYCKLSFMGVPLCKRAFCRVTRTKPQRYIKLAKRGVLSWVRPQFAQRPHPKYDEMYAVSCARLPIYPTLHHSQRTSQCLCFRASLQHARARVAIGHLRRLRPRSS